MSTGVKIAIGCGVAAVLVVVLLIVAGVAGGLFLKDKAEDFAGGIEAQEEANETIRRLEEEHSFSPPEDGVIDVGRAETFFEVTDDAWERMRDDMEDIAEREQASEERGGEPGLRDMMAGVRGLGRSRVALAEALEDHDMPVSEYLWTGLMLMRAYENLNRPADESGVAVENLEIAADHRAELADLASGPDDGGPPDRSFVLGMALTWGMSEEAVRTIGWDTLGVYAP
ncbi:MAG TPA: hypothetical protein VM737_07180 [Gemmatimonadota bacterium]|nr:hypothetical protein [Gemmatimonadota bacterium]